MRSVANTQSANQNCIPNLVLGAGVTGMSCLRYFESQNQAVKVYEEEMTADKHAQISNISKNIPIYDSGADLEDVLKEVQLLLVSPGVSQLHPLVQLASTRNIKVIGDVELFAQHLLEKNNKMLIAVTGSNGKSTVVTLVYLMAKEAGLKVSLAGNIGRPVLDALLDDDPDVYVLELSSFQLDITFNLHSNVASILNLSPDHLDRYLSYQDYCASKQNIYSNAKTVIWNSDDQLTKSKSSFHSQQLSFGLDENNSPNFSIRDSGDGQALTFGNQEFILVKDCKKNNTVDLQNALAASAIAYSAGISFDAITPVLKSFAGLEHRCELVADFDGVKWINDSKGTNIGATQAAILSMDESEHPSVILIAGGDSKGLDLSGLRDALKSKVKAMLLIGKDADKFQKAFGNMVECKLCKSLDDAIQYARGLAQTGDSVLLSPACASLDMFDNYQHRGEQFKECVHKYVVRASR